MGCDWTIHIQARFADNTWKTVFICETKTFCGGGPIRSGLKKAVLEHQMKGSHGVEYPTFDKFVPADQEIYEDGYHVYADELTELNHLYDPDGKPTGRDNLPQKRGRGESEEQSSIIHLSPQEVKMRRQTIRDKMTAIEERCQQAGLIGRYPAHHYFLFSLKDYTTFVECIPRGERPCYRTLLRPVGHWATMLRTAEPPDMEELLPWLDEDENEQVTQDIRKLQKTRKEEADLSCGNLGVVARVRGLPADVVRHVRDFLAPPVPREMRIALFDDEGNSQLIREGNLEDRDLCVVM